MSPRWTLGDAQALATQYPYTFYKPSPVAITALRPGNLAKLIFEFESDDPQAPGAERMWVLITGVNEQGFIGTLNNQPLYIDHLQPHDPVSFQARHIMGVDVPDPVPALPDRYLARCLVTNKVLREGEPVGYLYREEPDQDDDSGWSFLAGDETEDYLEDTANAAYVSLGAVLTVDDGFIDLLDREPGCAFVKDENGGFVEVVD
ncbi:immunity protein Imm33 domain-containing protein [Alloalcanivorax mobilis]|uniref:immunity protein Imm33 domain-containing protein n=1 Tax=Alloalcanivorax mobilis TaxID=2019569 RepID=UPI0018E4C25D|nr:DUF2185 domain-containing protein [Alloalcanivorax mobilis]